MLVLTPETGRKWTLQQSTASNYASHMPNARNTTNTRKPDSFQVSATIKFDCGCTFDEILANLLGKKYSAQNTCGTTTVPHKWKFYNSGNEEHAESFGVSHAISVRTLRALCNNSKHREQCHLIFSSKMWNIISECLADSQHPRDYSGSSGNSQELKKFYFLVWTWTNF